MRAPGQSLERIEKRRISEGLITSNEVGGHKNKVLPSTFSTTTKNFLESKLGKRKKERMGVCFVNKTRWGTFNM